MKLDMKYLLTILFMFPNVALCQVTEKVKLLDGRSVQLNYDGTYKILDEKAEGKRTHSQLRNQLTGKSLLEVKNILGAKPAYVTVNTGINNEDGSLYYPYGGRNYAEGESWKYTKGHKILWNPILEQYEGFYIYFFNGKFFSIVRAP